MTDREQGFYWVKYRGGWEIAYNSCNTGHCWQFTGTDLHYDDEELDEIGPKIEPPCSPAT